MHGPLHRFFSADHRRLDALLRRSIEDPGQVNLARLRVDPFPEPPLKPYNDGPEIQKHIDLNLALARRQWAADADEGR